MHEQLKTDNLNTVAINSFLEEVTGVLNPKVRYGALKYSTKKMYSFGTSDINYVAERLTKHNYEWGHEIFFSVRARIEAPCLPKANPPSKKSGKSKKPSKSRKKWMNRAPGCFLLDVDCGTSDTDLKQARLIDCLTKAESRSCLPTHIVQTRNGFHFYWAIEGTLSTVEIFDPEAIWREVQKALAEIYGGDPKIIGPNQMIRLPGTFHWKNELSGLRVTVHRTGTPNHCLDHILKAHGLKTLNQRLAEEFGLDPDQTQSSPDTPENPHRKTVSTPRKRPMANDQNDLKEAGPDVDPYEEDIYKAVGLALSKGKGDLEALKRYLGVNTSTCLCPFHPDKKPSGHISKTENGVFFKCHSSSCKVDFLDLQDAIKLKEKLKGRDLILRTLEVLRREDLVRRLEGKIAPPSKAYKQLSENEKFLLEVKPLLLPFSYGLPYNYGTVKWIKPFLEDFLRLAKKKLRNGIGSFPASLDEISKRKDPKRAAIKLYLLRLSGLVELAEMPEECRASLERFKAREKVSNDTSWHRIPLWTQEIFEEALHILAYAYSHGINTRSCTRKQVRETFGPEVEARVFFGASTQRKGYDSEWDEVLEEQQRQLEWMLSLTDEEFDRAFNPNRPDDSTEETFDDESEAA